MLRGWAVVHYPVTIVIDQMQVGDAGAQVPRILIVYEDRPTRTDKRLA